MKRSWILITLWLFDYDTIVRKITHKTYKHFLR